MADTAQYEVSYLINVQSNTATENLSKFNAAVDALKGKEGTIKTAAESMQMLSKSLNSLKKGGYNVNIKLPAAKQLEKIAELTGKINALAALVQKPLVINIDNTAALASLTAIEQKVKTIKSSISSLSSALKGVGTVGGPAGAAKTASKTAAATTTAAVGAPLRAAAPYNQKALTASWAAWAQGSGTLPGLRNISPALPPLIAPPGSRLPSPGAVRGNFRARTQSALAKYERFISPTKAGFRYRNQILRDYYNTSLNMGYGSSIPAGTVFTRAGSLLPPYSAGVTGLPVPFTRGTVGSSYANWAFPGGALAVRGGRYVPPRQPGISGARAGRFYGMGDYVPYETVVGGTTSSGGIVPLGGRAFAAGYMASRYRGRAGGRTPWRVNPRFANNALGHAEISNPMALSMLKGMGIGYGLSAVMGGVGNVVRDATEYNNVMQTARNILSAHDTNGGFDSRFSQMQNTIRQIGIETKYTAPEVASAAKFLAMAGLNVEAIKTSMPAITDLALIGDTDLAATADVTTNIMTAYGIRPSGMRKAADVMTQTFTMSNTTLMEIAEAYKYSASLLAAAGVDFETSAAAFGVLGDAGIKASQAGTSLRTIINNIVKPTKPQLDEWKYLKIKRYDKEDEKGNPKEGAKLRSLIDIFADLNEKNVPVDAYYKLFRLTAAQGAAALAMGVDRWQEVMLANVDSAGLSSKLAEAKKNTIQGQWAQLTSSFTEQGLRAFEQRQGAIVDKLKEFTSWMQGDKASEMFATLTDRIWALGQTIVDFTGFIGKGFNLLSGPLTGFLQLELIMGSIAIAARSIKSVGNVFGMVGNWGKQLVGGTAYSASARNIGVMLHSMNRRSTVRGDKINLLKRVGLGNVGTYASSSLNRAFSSNMAPGDIQRLQSGQVPLLAPGQVGRIYDANEGWIKVNKANNFYEQAQKNTQDHLMRREQLLYQRRLGYAQFRSGVISTVGSGILGGLGGYLGSQIGENTPWLSLVGAAGLGSLGYALPSMLAGAGLGAAGIAGISAGAGAVAALAIAYLEARKSANAAAQAHVNYVGTLAKYNNLGIQLGDENPFAKYMIVAANATYTANQALDERVKLLKQELGLTKSKELMESNSDANEGATQLSSIVSRFTSGKARVSLASAFFGDPENAAHLTDEEMRALYPYAGIDGYYAPAGANNFRHSSNKSMVPLYAAGIAKQQGVQTGQKYVEDLMFKISLLSNADEAANLLAETDKIVDKYLWADKTSPLDISWKDAKNGKVDLTQLSYYNNAIVDQLEGRLNLIRGPLMDYFSNGTDESLFALLDASGSKLPLTSPQNGTWKEFIEKSKYFEGTAQNEQKRMWNEGYNSAITLVTSTLPQDRWQSAVEAINRRFAGIKVSMSRENKQMFGTDPFAMVDGEEMSSQYGSSDTTASNGVRHTVVNINSLLSVDNVDLTNPTAASAIENIKEMLAEALLGVVSDFSIATNNIG